jgi:hypothetical protein
LSSRLKAACAALPAVRAKRSAASGGRARARGDRRADRRRRRDDQEPHPYAVAKLRVELETRLSNQTIPPLVDPRVDRAWREYRAKNPAALDAAPLPQRTAT